MTCWDDWLRKAEDLAPKEDVGNKEDIKLEKSIENVEEKDKYFNVFGRNEYMEKDEYESIVSDYQDILDRLRRIRNYTKSRYYGCSYNPLTACSHGDRCILTLEGRFYDGSDQATMFVSKELISELGLDDIIVYGDRRVYTTVDTLELWNLLNTYKDKLGHIKRIKHDIAFYEDKLIETEKFDRKSHYSDLYKIIESI